MGPTGGSSTLCHGLSVSLKMMRKAGDEGAEDGSGSGEGERDGQEGEKNKFGPNFLLFINVEMIGSRQIRLGGGTG